MGQSVAYDLTNWPEGEKHWFYDLLTSRCPLCNRVGIPAFFDDDLFMHVVVFQRDDDGTEHAPIWIADLCTISADRLTLSSPADQMPNRIKHPYELNEPDGSL